MQGPADDTMFVHAAIAGVDAAVANDSIVASDRSSHVGQPASVGGIRSMLSEALEAEGQRRHDETAALQARLAETQSRSAELAAELQQERLMSFKGDLYCFVLYVCAIHWYRLLAAVDSKRRQ